MEIVLGLIKGRHDLPVDNFIFVGPISLTDVVQLEREAHRSLVNIAYDLGVQEWDQIPSEYYGIDEVVYDFPRNKKVVIYVTGLTVALIAVLNVLKSYNAEVTIMHYNAEDSSYYPQKLK
jgi:hypothetical protein